MAKETEAKNREVVRKEKAELARHSAHIVRRGLEIAGQLKKHKNRPPMIRKIRGWKSDCCWGDLKFSSNSRWLSSWCTKSIQLWDISFTREEPIVIPFLNTFPHDVFAPGYEEIIMGDRNGKVTVWDIKSARLLNEFWATKIAGNNPKWPEKRWAIRGTGIASDPDSVFVKSEDGSVTLWDYRKGLLVNSFMLPADSRDNGMPGIFLGTNGNFVIYDEECPVLGLLDVRGNYTYKSIKIGLLEEAAGSYFDAISYDGALMAVCNTITGTTLLYDIADQKNARKFIVREPRVAITGSNEEFQWPGRVFANGENFDMAFSRDKDFLFLLSSDGKYISLIDINNETIAWTLETGERPSAKTFMLWNRISVSPNGMILACRCRDAFSLWEIDNG